MFSKFRLPALVLGTALTVLSPGPATARNREHERETVRNHRYDVRVCFGHPRHYANGHYDRFGFWHANR